MNPLNPRTGITIRMVIGTLAAILLLPLMILGGFLVNYRKIDAQQIDDVLSDSAQFAPSRLDPPLPAFAAEPPYSHTTGEHSAESRTVLQEQTRTAYFPVTDPRTGRTTYQARTHVVRVPTVQYHHSVTPTHGPEVTALAQQLRNLKTDDPQRAANLEKLKDSLLAEFTQRHQQQQDEIEKTAKRLESLREMHQQRENNKEQIVQRRIDQLLGQPDVLDWNPAHPTAPQPYIDPNSKATSPRFAPETLRPAVPAAQTRTEILPSGDELSVSPPANSFPPLPGRTRSQLPPNRTGVVSLGVATDPAFSSRRIEVSSFDSNDVFQWARRLSSVTLAQSSAAAELVRLKSLHEQGAVPQADYQAAENKAAQAENDLRFARAEWQAMLERHDRDLEFAESRLERTLKQVAAVRAAVDNGIESSRALMEAEGLMEQARKSLDDMLAKSREIEQANVLIDRLKSARKETDGSPVNEKTETSVQRDVEVKVETPSDTDSDSE